MQTHVKKLSRCLPVGDLPYDTDKAATKMIVKLFEDMPYLANMPLVSEDETLLHRTFGDLPGVKVQGKKVVFKDGLASLKSKLLLLDSTFNNPVLENIEKFQFSSYFLPKYLQIVERIKPRETIINLLGPFSIALTLVTKDNVPFIADKFFRKYLIQAVTVRALWIINKIKMLSPDTRPIIMLEEPLLYKIGEALRNNDEISRETIINMLGKITSKIQETGAFVGIQCFEKCDWKVPIEAGVNIISFDAYNNPNNLNIIAEQINEFLAKGGRINWGIVPVMNEKIVKDLSLDYVFDRLIKTFEGLIIAGASERLVYNHAMVSIQGNINHLPIIFAEKALIISSQLAKRIPIKS